jgi:hypothetical protein
MARGNAPRYAGDVLFLLISIGVLIGIPTVAVILTAQDGNPRYELHMGWLRGLSTPIATVTHGLQVKVIGRIRPVDRERLVTSPASGTACVGYWVSRERLTKVELDQATTDFLVEDESGAALVPGGEIALYLDPARGRSGGAVREQLLVEGEVVAVCGFAEWQGDVGGVGDGAGYRGMRRLVLRPRKNHHVVVSNRAEALFDQRRLASRTTT